MIQYTLGIQTKLDSYIFMYTVALLKKVIIWKYPKYQ